jgi:hypothetical protein
MTGTILMIAGSVMTAVGQLRAGASAEAAANLNAQVGYQNAHAARLAALEDSKRQRRLAAKRQGERRALDPDKLDLLEDNAIEDELEALTRLHSGEVRAIGSENTAGLDIARGKSAMPTAVVGAAGSVLMGGATALEGSSLFTSSPPIIPPRRY